MRITADKPEELWKLYCEGREYNSWINLYRTVSVNEDFYAGDQWRGLDAPDIDKPVVNIIRQPVNYMAATIVGNDVAIDLKPSLPSADDERFLDAVKSELERIREQNDMENLNREAIRNASVDGDACLFHYWDSSIKTGQASDGDVRIHLIENTRSIFGNPTCSDPQQQPYIQIVMRDYVEDVIDEAVANGMSAEDARNKIKPDVDYQETEPLFDKLVTKLLTFFRKDGTIHAVISTAKTIIRTEWDTKLTLYPVAWLSWQRSRSSYHGVSIVTELVPTQICINKLVANYVRCVSLNAWTKVIYNAAVFPNGWDSRVGANIKVQGDPTKAYAVLSPGVGVSADVEKILNWIMSKSKESSGANDAALGQVKSDNTSAIIAMQEANTVPLDLVQRGFYSFQEQSIRITLDMLRANAGIRDLPQQKKDDKPMLTMRDFRRAVGNYLAEKAGLPAQLGDPQLTAPEAGDKIGTPADPALVPEETMQVDFGKLGDMAWRLKVSVGAGSYFSEALRNTTLGNLVQMGIMDAIDYYKRIPEKYVPNKQEIIDKLEKLQQMQADDPAPLNNALGGGMGGGTADGAAIPEDGAPDIGESMPIKQAKKYITGMRPGV